VNLARTLRFDESDSRVFEHAAEGGEWAVSGAFAFADWTEADLTGRRRQAFANGWLSLGSFGHATFVAVAPVTEAEYDQLAMRLAAHFVHRYGAPGLDAALPVARGELDHMAELCAGHRTNTLPAVARTLREEGVHEAFRIIPPTDTTILDLVPDHGH